jgi:dTDP-4-dehydrorhamnose 3,5-epimerase
VIFVETRLPGAFLVELEPRKDERGAFARTWCRTEFAARGLSDEISQCSLSRNTRAGTLRGLHFQTEPHAETKLVRCTRGAIFDVIVDLRTESETEGEWLGVELSSSDGTALYVPKGFAHGFQTLVDETEVFYTMSDPYVPEASTGVRWDDPTLGIEWPEAQERIISERDLAWPDYAPGSRRRRSP